MLVLSLSACPGPVIRNTLSGDKVKPPLFTIDNGYPEEIAKSEPDPRFSERLKKALEQADALGEIDVNNPPPTIESVAHGWFGENYSLQALVEVFPETFRLRRSPRIHIHITGAKYLDNNHVVDVNATLISKDGKSKYVTKKIFPSHGIGWKNISVLEMNPWNTRESRARRVKPGGAKLSLEISTRKILDERAKTYSEPIENVKTDAINVFIQPGRALLPEKSNKVMIRFQKAVRSSDWVKALEYCSKKIKSKAEKYDSTETFFNDVLPIDKIIALSGFKISGTGSRNEEVIRYSCEIRLKYTDYKWSLNWNLSVIREEANWFVEFPTKPLDVWLKHEVLKMKVGNDNLLIEPEKSQDGFEVRLIPLTKEIAIGNPMLFRVEMKNITDETLGYTDTSFMVNDPMLVKDSNGTIVPYIDTSYQTIARPEFVEPGETVILADNYDARSQYQITKPDKYTFQFKGSWDIKPSNVVKMDIESKPLAALERIVEDLLPILPEGWELTRRVMPANELAKEQNGEAVLANLTGKRTGKQVEIAAQIMIFLDSNYANVKLRNHLTELELWGQSQWGPVYVKSHDAELLWPDYKEQIMKVLVVEKLR